MKRKGRESNYAKNSSETGFHSLVALVLAMQADKLVITSGSNWSRLMEELCFNAEMMSECDIVDLTPHRPMDW